VRASDVRGITDITDTMVWRAARPTAREVIADRVLQRCKEAGFRPYGMKASATASGCCSDLQDVVLHVMLPRDPRVYALEKLWEGGAAAVTAAVRSAHVDADWWPPARACLRGWKQASPTTPRACVVTTVSNSS